MNKLLCFWLIALLLPSQAAIGQQQNLGKQDENFLIAMSRYGVEMEQSGKKDYWLEEWAFKQSSCGKELCHERRKLRVVGERRELILREEGLFTGTRFSFVGDSIVKTRHLTLPSDFVMDDSEGETFGHVEETSREGELRTRLPVFTTVKKVQTGLFEVTMVVYGEEGKRLILEEVFTRSWYPLPIRSTTKLVAINGDVLQVVTHRRISPPYRP